ncbi:MAG TPA: hypothetical protein ENN29_09120, partial [Candidatus Hydrogenedentes bacterium]|nr:hypothetical protein [Candidatus Hydrogenedentota bacterium]
MKNNNGTIASEKRGGAGNGTAGALSSKTGRMRMLQWLGILLAFLICVAALTREPTRDILFQADMDSPVSNREIRAMFYFESVDLQRTQEAREQEAAKVPDYYRIDRAKVLRQLDLLKKRIARLRDEREIVSAAIMEGLRASTPDQPVESI